MKHWVKLFVLRRPTFNKFPKWGESIVDFKPISEVGIKFEYTRKASITCTTSSTRDWLDGTRQIASQCHQFKYYNFMSATPIVATLGVPVTIADGCTDYDACTFRKQVLLIRHCEQCGVSIYRVSVVDWLRRVSGRL